MKWKLLLLFTGAAAYAQEPRFNAKTHEVVVPVSVTTKAGKAVENLAEEDFLVLNDGIPRVAKLISQNSEPLPIHGVIVLQTDDGSQPALAKIKKTASIISTYITGSMDTGTPSLAAVITVADHVRVAQPFTADPGILGDTFAKLSANKCAARLLDGVSLACDLLTARKEPARRVVILISESRDVQSSLHFADVAIKAQKAATVIYTISYSAFTTAFTQKPSDRPPLPDQPGLYDPKAAGGGMNLLALPAALAQLAKLNVAEAFAQVTGGDHRHFTTLHGLDTQLTAISNEIHNRYTLMFVAPDMQPAGYHRLSVSVRNVHHSFAEVKDWRVHARAAYWSEPD